MHLKYFENKNILAISFSLAIVTVLIFALVNREAYTRESLDAEERPHYEIDAAEQAFYDNISKQKQQDVRMKSATTVENYANGKIKGYWKAKQFSIPSKVNYGFRMIGSAYDKAHNIFYVVSHAGHIWRIDYNEIIPTQTQWTSINHSHAFMTTSRKEWFDVLNWKDGDQVYSRMLRSFNNKIEYSDDEGRNWYSALGILFQETGDQGCVAGSDKGDRAVVLAKVAGAKEVALSYDGINYISCGLNLTSYEYETKLLKPHHTNNVYVVARHTSTSKISIYRMTPDSEVFTLLHSSSVSVKSPTKVIGTFAENKYHFYYIQGNENYYSDDEGATWTKTAVSDYGNTDGNSFVRTIHPDKPQTLFRGYLDVYVSNNKGSSFSNWGHKLGWDVHHMRMYERKDGSYIHLVGKDFGVFLSKTPETRDSYFSINHSSPAQLAYDMDVSDNFGTAFTATQDRGSISFDNTDTPSKTDIRTTDGLRVTLANNEKTIWTWMYFGSIYHTANEGYGTAPIKSVEYSGNWVAGSMIAHPNADNDAVVIANEGQYLSILSYDEEKKSIDVENHTFDFKDYTGQNVTSFGYSPVNTNIWYAAVKDGAFLFSKDGGNTFKKSLSGKLAKGNDQGYNYHRNQQVIKASKLDEKKVFFAGVKNAFYISTNNGLTFKTHSDGLNVWRIRDFELSEDEKFIFAACGIAGPWVFSVEDDKWYPMDGPNVPYVDFTSVSYTPSKGMVQFGTYGYGVLDFKFDRGDNTLVAPVNLSAVSQSFSSVTLTWNDDNSGVDKYQIRRSSDLENFEDVSLVDANSSSFTDRDLIQNTTYYYRVIAKKGDESSLPSDLVFVTTKKIALVNNASWRLIYASSEAEGNSGEKAFDNTSTTAWMSFNNSSFPQELKIDLGQEEDLAAFTYQPASSGVIKSYALYVSNDSLEWGEAISQGSWTDENDAAGIVDFNPTKGRYVRFVAHSVFAGTQVGIAELQLWPGFDSRLDAPINLSTKALSSTVMVLKWENISVNADGYIIERKSDGDYHEVARVTASLTSYFDRELQPYTTYNYRITAYRNDDKSPTSEAVEGTTSATGLISSTSWQVLYKDSESVSNTANKAIDSNTSTWWSSAASAMPHEIQLDLGKEESIAAFSYVPNYANGLGMIKDYEFYISNDKNNWGSPVASGTWTNMQRKNVSFSPQLGRYTRFIAKSALDGGNVTHMAELMLWKSYAGTTPIKTVQEVEVNIYPVPFIDKLSVSLNKDLENYTVQLLDTKGRVIETVSVNNGNAEISLKSDLIPGIYFVKLQGNGQTLIRKIIKQ